MEVGRRKTEETTIYKQALGGRQNIRVTANKEIKSLIFRRESNGFNYINPKTEGKETVIL